ncbi:unnamed protein product [Urochloa humidicola]
MGKELDGEDVHGTTMNKFNGLSVHEDGVMARVAQGIMIMAGRMQPLRTAMMPHCYWATARCSCWAFV